MRFALWAMVAALVIGANLLPSLAEAKSVKWTCVITNPLTPWAYTCTGSTRRP